MNDVSMEGSKGLFHYFFALYFSTVWTSDDDVFGFY